MARQIYNRRQVLVGGLGAAIALGASKRKALDTSRRRIIKAATSTPAAGSDLGAVEHVVFLMHENRSFDHYFGTLGGVNGFGSSENSASFTQNWPGGANSTLLPFHLDTTSTVAECTYDLSHSWQAEHSSWNSGAMDSFVSTHVSDAYEGPDLGTLTMGYYTENDIPFYYALAQAFTICDNYFCSVLGPTHPNRLMQMTGTLDPTGAHGGPVLVTNSDNDLEFTCSWTTMPEVLDDAGVSWKVYNPHGSEYAPRHPDSMLRCKNVLMYFEQYRRYSSDLHRKAFQYYGPPVEGTSFSFTSPGHDNFAQDVKHNQLPAVSWLIPPDGYDEHPPAPAALGEWYSAQVLTTLMSNPEVWASTVLFIMYDENDGWFDHVPPPTAPDGTAGEYLSQNSGASGGILGPIGMGVRVPMLVVSPFSRGGWVCSDVFDHTSQLQFVAERFGVELPNVSQWRQETAGDLTATLPALLSPNTSVPTLPVTSQSTTTPPISTECAPLQLAEANIAPNYTYPVTVPTSLPSQGPDTLTPTPS